MSFNKETLINLGEHHKKIMKMIDTNLKKLTTTKELYYLIENYFKENNLSKSFPIGISINEFIAHDSYHEFEKIKFKKGDLIKVDFGMEKEGNIIDAARTFEYNDNCSIESINDCRDIVLEIENYSRELLRLENKITVQKLSQKIYDLITKKGYFALDFLGGHNIEFGKVHGKKLILNKPLEKLPPQSHKFIDKDWILEEGEMFAVEVFIPSKSEYNKETGKMVQNIRKNPTHFEVDRDLLDKKEEILKERDDLKKIIDELVLETKLLPFNYMYFKKYSPANIKELIDKKLIVVHLPLEWVDINKRKLKYIQYEDCYLIINNDIICLTR